MWRALFFLGGFFLSLQGAIVLAVEEVQLHDWAASRLDGLVTSESPRIAIPIWLAPTLVSTGGVTLLYAIALPGKKADD